MNRLWRAKVVNGHKASTSYSNDAMLELTLVSDKNVQLLLESRIDGLVVKACGKNLAKPSSYTVCPDPAKPGTASLAYVEAVLRDAANQPRPATFDWERFKKSCALDVQNRGPSPAAVEVFAVHYITLERGIADKDRIRRVIQIQTLITETPDLDLDELMEIWNLARVAEVNSA